MKRILLSVLASGLFAGAMAIPAKPGFVAYTQPDGTVINLRMAGDEHGHMIYSEDGLLLVESNGRMEYAKFDAVGLPEPSGIPVGSRVDASTLSVQLQPKHLLDGWQEKMTANKAARLTRLREAGARRASATRSGDEKQNADDGRLVPMNFGRCESTFPVLGEQKALVILVGYQDFNFKYGDFDYFNRMLNEEGFSDYGSLGSARDWFVENSGGLFLPDFDVYGPVILPHKRDYYGGNDMYGNDLHPEEMAIHACQILDEEVDFSQYDRDGDGWIDNVFIFFAEKGEHDSNVANAVWPHSWDVAAAKNGEEFVFDGVKLNHYACTCEIPSGYKRPDGIGTFVHEFSHVIGLPDLYVTNYSGGFTPGEWSVMDQGPYNNDRLTPPNYSSYEKCALGWIDFKPFAEGLIEINDLSTTNEAYALPTDNENEFFFFENRQQLGNDEFLPGHGMLVWHIDYNATIWRDNAVNNNSKHQYVDLIEADNIKSNSTRAADAFPGPKNVTAFGFSTKPQLESWSKQCLAYDLTDIAESEDGIISFNAVPNEDNAVSIIEGSQVGNNIYYDLMGRPVSNPGKGIYIINGKKVVL